MKTHGAPLPDETKRAAREADGVLFGAAGPSSSPVVVVAALGDERVGAACGRSATIPGMHSPLADPEGIDYVILRENSEGIYPGREGDLADIVPRHAGSERPDRPHPEASTATRDASRSRSSRRRRRAHRALRLRARRASARPRGKPGKVTCVTKSNVLPQTDGLFQETVERVVREAGLDVRALPRGRRRPPAGALPEVDGRRAVHEPLRRHPVRPRRRDGGRPRPGAVRLLRRRAGRTSSRCTARRPTSRGAASPTRPRRSCSAALMLDHMGLSAEASGCEARGGARLPRRQDADARPGRHGQDARHGRRPCSRRTATHDHQRTAHARPRRRGARALRHAVLRLRPRDARGGRPRGAWRSPRRSASRCATR